MKVRKYFICLLMVVMLAVVGCTPSQSPSVTAPPEGEPSDEGEGSEEEEEPSPPAAQTPLPEGEASDGDEGEPSEIPQEKVNRRPGYDMQTDGEYLYAKVDEKLIRYRLDDLSDGKELFTGTSDYGYTYHAVDGEVYLAETFHSRAGDEQYTILHRINAEDAFDTDLGLLEGEDIRSVCVTGENLYLEGEQSGDSDKPLIRSYRIKEDGKLEETDEAKGWTDMLPTGFHPVREYQANHLSSAFMIETTGELYGFLAFDDTDGYDFVAADPVSGDVRSINTELSPWTVIDITENHLILEEYTFDDNDMQFREYSAVSLSDGERKIFLRTGGFEAEPRVTVLDFDDEGMYYCAKYPDLDRLDFLYAPFEADVPKDLFSTEYIPNPLFNDGVMNTVRRGGLMLDKLCYTRIDEDYNTRLFRCDTDGREERAQGVTFFDPRFKEVGMSFVDEVTEYHYLGKEENPVLMTCTLSYPQLDDRYEGSGKINAFFQEKAEAGMPETDTIDEEYTYFLEAREENDPEGIWSPFPYTYECRTAGISYFDGAYLCIGMQDYTYLGGAHGYGVTSYDVFDLASGEQLELSDIIGLSEDTFLTLVAKEIIAAEERGDIVTYGSTEGMSKSEAVDYWKDYFSDREMNDFIFALRAEQLEISFSAYDIAAYVAGQQSIFLPYEDVELTVPIGPR